MWLGKLWYRFKTQFPHLKFETPNSIFSQELVWRLNEMIHIQGRAQTLAWVKVQQLEATSLYKIEASHLQADILCWHCWEPATIRMVSKSLVVSWESWSRSGQVVEESSCGSHRGLKNNAKWSHWPPPKRCLQFGQMLCWPPCCPPVWKNPGSLC